MTAKSNTHGPAENQMSTGFTLDGFPSVGAWISYALGSECRDLPAFVAIPDPRGVPQVGPNNWGSAFLPAVFQGTPSTPTSRSHTWPGRQESRTVPSPIPATSCACSTNEHLEPDRATRNWPHGSPAMSWPRRCSFGPPRCRDLAKESRTVHEAYGATDQNKVKAGFARNCILARRLLERDVRFVQLFNGAYAMGEGVGNWDGHKTIKAQYDIHGPILDQPCAALLTDLKRTGLLDDTLVVWVTEFGRMPTFQKGASGRDHNPKGFTVWLAGAGVKRGFSYGATDEFGYRAVENVATVYDLHATILHLLGLDHERLSFYHNGIERRLTDVHGHVIREVLA